MVSKSLLTRQKGQMMGALGLFLVEVVAIIAISSLKYGLHLEWTISRYVGLETWSALLFALGNLGVAFLMLRYLYGIGERFEMGRGFYILVVVVVIALVGLSVCPLGYFDITRPIALSNAVSRIHEICSRTMFAVMVFLAVMMVFCRCATERTKIMAGVFIVYGVVCAFGFFVQADWFIQAGLVFETLYILGFMGLCLGCREHDKDIIIERRK